MRALDRLCLRIAPQPADVPTERISRKELSDQMFSKKMTPADRTSKPAGPEQIKLRTAYNLLIMIIAVSKRTR